MADDTKRLAWLYRKIDIAQRPMSFDIVMVAGQAA
jgi:hypothetical protein